MAQKKQESPNASLWIHAEVDRGSASGVSRDTAILSLQYPISRDTFSGRLALPQNGAIPPLLLSFTQAHQCDTQFCNISRDNCAIPHTKQAQNSFAILLAIVSRDMKSIAIGPPSSGATAFAESMLFWRHSAIRNTYRQMRIVLDLNLCWVRAASGPFLENN